jgi:HNH endonuclease
MPEPRLTPHQRTIVVQRARACCEYCGAQERFSPDPFSVEHIAPLARGGTHDLDNLAYACQGCNGRKYTSTEAIDPATGEWVALYHPRLHTWTDHFVWNAEYTLVLGKTPIGRATIEKLQLNRTGLANLRAVLAAQKLHPLES